MKSKELMQIFELSAKIMSYYKNKDVVYALNDILDMCKNREESSEVQKINNVTYSESSYHDIEVAPFIENVDSMSIDEIYNKLNNRTIFPNVESIKKFALNIGLRGQSRVNRENLIHSIIKFVERSRIDQDISSRVNR